MRAVGLGRGVGGGPHFFDAELEHGVLEDALGVGLGAAVLLRRPGVAELLDQRCVGGRRLLGVAAAFDEVLDSG